jgi:hypothetical protein
MATDNEKKTDIEKNYVVDVKENFRGRSYGDWVATWSNWLLSEDPDRSNEGEGHMLFLRGSLAYYEYSKNRQDLNSLPDAQRFYNRTGDQCIIISEGTAIFIPVLTALYFLDAPFEGSVLANEEQVRYAARKENDKSGGIWARLQRADRPKAWEPIVYNLESYRVESPVFKLSISEKNPFLKYYATEYPLSPGEHEAVTDGYFLIMKNLPYESCRIQFGGKGRHDYRTDSVYDLHVTTRPRGLIKDVSKGNEQPSVLFQYGSSGIPTHNLPALQKLSNEESTK